jgi:uncharacterized protein (TIGR02145 family)
MRFFCLLVFFIFSCNLVTAQQGGIGTNSPHPSASLEIYSTTKGFLPPRMNFSQRNAIQQPATGLIIYCTDCDSAGQPQIFNGSKWCNLMGETAASPILLFDTSVEADTIGIQIWSTRNLSIDKYRNGDLIPQVSDPTQWANLTSGAWCWYNNDSATYGSLYGRLYNWYALQDPRGLAPAGWRLPKESDWNQLIKFLDPTADTSCLGCTQSATAGRSMKSDSGWFNGGNGNNSSGFSALPAGNRNLGTFFNEGLFAVWWSASDFNTTLAWFRFLINTDHSVNSSLTNKANGFSIRVLRDF